MSRKLFIIFLCFLFCVLFSSIPRNIVSFFGVEAAMQDSAERYEHLNSLEDTDLRQIIYEKTKGRAPMSRFVTRESLLEAVIRLEEEGENANLLAKIQPVSKSSTPGDARTVKILFCTG